MIELDKNAIDAYYALYPTRYTLLERLNIRQGTSNEANDFAVSLEIELRHKEIKDQRMILFFEGVRNISFTPPKQSVLQVIQLEIVPIESYGWESVKYSVQEVESEVLSFLCVSFITKVI